VTLLAARDGDRTGPRRDRYSAAGLPSRAWPALFLIFAMVFIALMHEWNLAIMVPLFTALSVTTAFYGVLWWRRYPHVPWFEPGAVYIAVVSLYTVYPLVGYLAIGQTYTPFNDSRLFALQPAADEVARTGWLHVSHLAGFALAYPVARGRLRIAQPPIRRPGLPLFLAVAFVYLTIEAFALVLGLFFFDTPAADYAGTYLVARSLPLVFGQLLNHLTGMKHVLAVMLMAALLSRYPGSRPIILGWIALAAVLSLARLGSRTELVLLIMAATMMYHLLIRPMSPRLMVAAAAVGLAGFIGFGLARAGVQPGSAVAWNPFVYASEFETLFANALHLARVTDGIGPLPATFHFADLAALVPQQLAPFTKVDRADWYVSTFFPAYAATGGGLAFGTMAEAVLTGGWPSAVMRGIALGVLLALMHRFYARHTDRFWVFVFYVYVTTMSYQLFRNGTLSLLVLLLYRFLPAMLLVSILAAAIRRTARARDAFAPTRPIGA
jgi:oligosaccharide repeat unit polymerase